MHKDDIIFFGCFLFIIAFCILRTQKNLQNPKSEIKKERKNELMENIKKENFLRAIVAVIVFILAFILSWDVVLANTTATSSDLLPNRLRVGLMARSFQQANIRIDSTALEVGFSINDNFTSSGTLESVSGFVVTPATGIFVRLQQMFPSFSAALAESRTISGAVPALLEANLWGIYIPASDIGNAQQISNQHRNSAILGTTTDRIAITNGTNMVVVSENAQIMLHIRGTNGLTTLGDRTYRGIMEFGRFGGNTVTAVNIVGVQEYLYSVVPSEMPALWHLEALKAQATAARTYIFGRQHAHRDQGFYLCDTTHCQVYAGTTVEHARSTQAVRETDGIMIFHNNIPVGNAVFFSSSGGTTDSSENVWIAAVPYLRPIADIYETTARNWSRTFTMAELTNLLRHHNINIGSVSNVQINSSDNERVQELIFIGSTGRHTVVREAIRTFFAPAAGGSLDSRNFTIEGATFAGIPGASPPQSAPPLLPPPPPTIFIIDNHATTQTAINQLLSFDLQGNINILPNIFAIINSAGDITFRNSSPSSPSILFTGSLAMTATSFGQTVTFTGSGWGHGVGMSQHGANSMAQQGHGFDEILRWYYTGVEVR